MMRIIFWQNMPSPHQSPAIRQLSYSTGTVVTCIFAGKPDSQRKSIGWEMQEFGNAECFFQSEMEDSKLKELQSTKNAVHIVGGLFTINFLKNTLYTLIDNKQQIIIMTECGYGLGVHRYLAYMKWRYYLAKYDKYITAYLAIGQKGVDYLIKRGATSEKVFPYIYQVDCSAERITKKITSNTQTLKLLYMGQLIKRKGLDTLIKAMRKLDSSKVTLDIVGTGNLDEQIKSKVIRYNLNSKITFLGLVNSNQISNLLSQYDVLIVPSLFDGWAAVTNEALQCGVPAVVSDGAGSVDLVRSTGAGMSFHSGNYIELAKIIKDFYDKPEKIAECCGYCKVVAESISGESVARYLLQVLMYLDNSTGLRPVAPWTNKQMHKNITEISKKC